MTSSVARVKFIKTKVIFSYHTKGVSNLVSPNSNHKVKSYSCSNSSTKMGENEKLEKIFWITKRAISGLQIVAGFRDCKSRQEGLQVGVALGISNRGERVANWSWDFKLGQRLQVGVREISNRG